MGNAPVTTKPTLPWHSPLFYREAHLLAADRVKLIDHEGWEILIRNSSNAVYLRNSRQPSLR